MASLKVIRNADQTVTVRYGRKVAHVDVRGKTRDEAADAVRWAAIGIGISPSHEVVDRLLRADLPGGRQ